ncbi:MAG: hypothetical protein Q4G34_02440 [Micrococcus sp.]|nr:hypothetical protein [Micrococcus sp.]
MITTTTRTGVARAGATRTGALALLGATALVLSACTNDADAPDVENTAAATSAEQTTDSSSEEPTPEPEETETAEPTTAEQTFGTAEPNLAQAWDVADERLSSAESVRISGLGMETTDAEGATIPLRFGLVGAMDDSWSFGTITLGDGKGRSTMSFRDNDGVSYLRVDRATQGEFASLREVLGDRWVKGDMAGLGLEDLRVSTLIEDMVSGISEVDRSTMEQVPPRVTEEDGRQMFTYVEADTEDMRGRETAVTIDEDGYLVKVEIADDGGTITFTEWNEVSPAPTPEPSEILDMEPITG